MKFGKMTGFLVKVILICALSGGLAVVFNSARPEPYTFAELGHAQPPEIKEINTLQLTENFAPEKYTFVDARSDTDYSMGHIPKAVSIPSWAIKDELLEKAALVDRKRPVIVYCDGLSCGKSRIVAKKLLALGYRDITVFTDGIDGWIGAGMDLEAD
ncbi:rhodanese-like domain-containing protein [Maridesulfovibrio sp.]|jgi:rhodanese-related sulfurtransferase|uniref:rhodanese-like domain-containing protein n=1 Tax=Maridesulfovibrio sp. TaxID=2795000 RepID=UPI0029CA8236|nr:rhodanese-like domain-containing protein [Maridesulfovibrio sp.]